jgi:hypothetical protein
MFGSVATVSVVGNLSQASQIDSLLKGATEEAIVGKINDLLLVAIAFQKQIQDARTFLWHHSDGTSIEGIATIPARVHIASADPIFQQMIHDASLSPEEFSKKYSWGAGNPQTIDEKLQLLNMEVGNFMCLTLDIIDYLISDVKFLKRYIENDW